MIRKTWTLAEYRNLNRRRDEAAAEFLERCNLHDEPLVGQMIDNAALDGEVQA